MSIQKITQNDILKNGIKGLPTRPSTPSLYSGNVLSAEELKAAFDKLPTLIAERFNDLLAATGLFDEDHPADSFAELIATKLDASHSLADFFEDVKNGNLALYLTADAEGKSLTDVLSELRAEIAAKQKSYTVSVEGEGDFITRATFDGNHLTLTHGGDENDIVARANAYTDAPQGKVAEGCTAPVSGDSVARAVKETVQQYEDRISTLESVAEGNLYTYPIEQNVFAYKRLGADLLPNAALLQMGGEPSNGINCFPEQLLFDYSDGDLTITWDDEQKVLVMNGTLHPTDEPVRLAPFYTPIPSEDGYVSFGIFYRGGSVSTDCAYLRLFSNVSQSTELPFLMEDSTEPYNEFFPQTGFKALQIFTDTETVFENYRFNVVVSREFTTVRYEPHQSRNRYVVPRKLVAVGPNHWEGATEARGSQYVSLSPPYIPNIERYMIGFYIQTSGSATKTLVQFLNENQLVYQCTWSVESSTIRSISLSGRITEIRLYAAKTAEESIGRTVNVREIYFEPVEPAYEETPKYLPPHRDEIVFPPSLFKYTDRFLGFKRVSNYFDFEKKCFYNTYKSFCLDGSYDFVAESSANGIFSAPCVTPLTLQSGTGSFQPSAIFAQARNIPDRESIWFKDGRIFVQSDIFIGKEAEKVKYFFSICPIDIVYMDETETIFMDEDEDFFREIPTFSLRSGSYLYFCDENGDPIKTFSTIQYQKKIQTEAT